MTTYLNQHWIPRSYLKAWCDPSHPNKVVHTYKSDGTYDSWRPPSRIFSTNDLYTIKTNGQRDLATERILNRIESLFLKKLRELQKGSGLADGHRAAIALYVAAMRNRSPRARDHWQAFKDSVVAIGSEMQQALRRATPEERARMAAIPSLGSRDKHRSMTLDEARAAAIEPFGKWLLRHIRTEAEILEQLDLTIVEAPDGIGFITSDNPVVWYNANRPPEQQGRFGLGSPGIEVTMPLTPRLCALFTRTNREGTAGANQAFVNLINTRTLAFCDERFVANSSELVVDWLA
jgi:hypothetical protein